MRPLVLALPAALAVSMPLAGADAPRPTLRPGMVQPILKTPTQLAVEGFAGTPGETRTFHARLSSPPGARVALEGRKVFFSVLGVGVNRQLGSTLTDPAGKADLRVHVPTLDQGNYKLAAQFHGDEALAASNAEAGYTNIKAITHVVVSDFKWNDRHIQGSSPFGSFKVRVLRTNDEAAPAIAWITVWVNGEEQLQQDANVYADQYPLMLSKCIYPPPWKVRVQYGGDGAHAASSFEGTFN